MLSYIILAALAAAAPDGAGSTGGAFALTPGQSITVKVTPGGTQPTAEGDLKPSGPRFDGDAVRFAFQQSDSGPMLTVQNGYGRNLVYNADIYLASGQHGHTSTCPVMAHITSFEAWHDPIVRIEISQVRLTDQSEMVCQ